MYSLQRAMVVGQVDPGDIVYSDVCYFVEQRAADRGMRSHWSSAINDAQKKRLKIARTNVTLTPATARIDFVSGVQLLYRVEEVKV